MNKWIMYLRKSRADEELEKQGEGETLSKHRNFLLRYAKEHDISIVKSYEEIVSGESILKRPEMLKLLSDIETKNYSGVLVMDIDRLGRGDMQEQGLILETFKRANAKILTPRKLYDLNNEWDEEYSEFEAFMSRKELKLITRRLRAGVIRSVESGNYVSPRPPFGYDIQELKNGRTLVPNDKADVVRHIFDLYANHGMGCGRIAQEMKSLGIEKPGGYKWRHDFILEVIKNPIYIGKITWKKRKYGKPKQPGRKRYEVVPPEQWIVAEGKHPAIVSEELFEKANMVNKTKQLPCPPKAELVNPIAGIVVCKVCGTKMSRRVYNDRPSIEPNLICRQRCKNRASKIRYVEERILEFMDNWLDEYEIELKDEIKPDESLATHGKILLTIDKEITELKKQKEKLHDFLEREIYDLDTFMSRTSTIMERINSLIAKSKEQKKAVSKMKALEQNKNQFIPGARKALQAYKESNDVREKNRLIKSLVEKAVYYKDKKNWEDNFILEIYPKLPDTKA